MTRINLVHPSELINKHLMAEYRELPRVFSAVRKLVDRGGYEIYMEKIKCPEKYVLGTGHVKFFYNKIPWLRNRFTDLYVELTNNRGYKLDRKIYLSIRIYTLQLVEKTKLYTVYYKPTPEEIYINMARITNSVFKFYKEI